MWLACFAWLVWLCTRVELGGLKACCVFASVFLLLLLCLPPFMLVVLLCSGCLSFVLLHCLCGSLGVVVGFSFSLSDKTKKERIRFALFLHLVLGLYFKLSKAIIAFL